MTFEEPQRLTIKTSREIDMKMTNVKLLVAMVFVLSGCATVIQGADQKISFDLNPPEATCSVKVPESLPQTVTGSGNTLQVRKGMDDMVVTCKAQGYKSKTIMVPSATQIVSLLSMVFDISLGLGDMFTGAMWKYPDHVAIALDKEARE